MSEEIPIKCNCGRYFEVPPELAGMETLCPGCDAAIRVPRASRISTAEVPKLRGSDEDVDYLAMENPDLYEESILDKPITEVIKTQRALAEEEGTDSGMEIAPDVDERYCPKCREIIKKNAQLCRGCKTLYCTNCGGTMQIGRKKCPHCKYTHFKEMPEKGWTRKEKPFVCPHCQCLPSEKVPLCYACGKPFEEKKKEAWPPAASVKSAGNVMASARMQRLTGRESMKMGLAAWFIGLLGISLGVFFIAPRNELGGQAWLVLTWGTALALSGRGGWLGWQAYHSPGEERWSTMAGMGICGATLFVLLLPHILFPTVSAGQVKDDLAGCHENLIVLGEALRLYKKDHENNTPPPDNDQFFAAIRSYLDSGTPLRCPGRDADIGYECFDDRLPLPKQVTTSRDMPIIWCRDGNHPEVRNVLFLDGHVERIEDAEFRTRVREAKERIDTIRKQQ